MSLLTRRRNREWWPPSALEAVHVVRAQDYETHGIYFLPPPRRGRLCDAFAAEQALRAGSGCDLSEAERMALRLWVQKPRLGLRDIAERMSIDIRVAVQKLRDAQQSVSEWADSLESY